MSQQKQKNKSSALHAPSNTKITLRSHLLELKQRGMWVLGIFIVSAVIAYPLFPYIVALLRTPLGGQQLYYTTVTGGIGFVFKVCLYIGILGALPALIYHLYSFLAPTVKQTKRYAIVIYTALSVVCACVGIAFAYFISLPAAIKFLINIDIDKVSAMLSVDSYLSFVIAYFMAGAILFQIPLVLMIINSITPLKPSKLMSFQRYMIVIAFIFGAILSPTPDPLNQLLLAGPVVIMYQFGVLAVWMSVRSERKKQARLQRKSIKQARKEVRKPRTRGYKQPVVRTAASAHQSLAVHVTNSATSTRSAAVPVKSTAVRRSIDGMPIRVNPRTPSPIAPAPHRTHAAMRPRTHTVRRSFQNRTPRPSVDGIMTFSTQNVVASQ